MIKKIGTALAASAIALFTALPVVADNNFYINPAIGYEAFDSKRDLDNEAFLSLGLEYRYSTNWGVELSILDSSPDFELAPIDVDLQQYGLDAVYYFNNDSAADDKLEQYATFGVGHADFDAGIADSRETQGRAGLGARYFISEKWALKGDVKFIYGLDEDTVDTLLMLGISYAFNGQNSRKPAAKPVAVATPSDSDGDGVIDANDQCLSTPAGVSVDANGCAIDTDGDGVANYKDQCPQTPAGRQVDEKGCKFVLTSTEEVTLRVVFPTNSSVVPVSYYAEIKRVADFMAKYGSVNADIEGHTDDRGDAGYNQSLSQRRADAVMKVLVEQYGVSSSRLTATGYGEAKPVATNATSEGRQENRRVVAVMQAEVSE